jgi:acyl dehydratase
MLRLTGAQAVQNAVGADLGWTDWFEVDQSRVDSFAYATRDDEWIHVDVDRASAAPILGGTIVHGFLTLGMLGFFTPLLLDIRGFAIGYNYGVDHVRFPSPVRTGSQVRCGGRIAACETLSDGVRLSVQYTVETKDGGKPCCVATLIARFYNAPALE